MRDATRNHRVRHWEALSPGDMLPLLAGFPHPWWICGGHAIDAFLGRTTREHGDLDVGVMRLHQAALYARLDAFEVHIAHAGELRELSPTEREVGTLDPDHHGVWCRRRGSRAWHFEVLLGDGDERDWVYRRCDEIRRPLNEVLWQGDDGLSYLAPEVQLLFKAKQPREKDELDLRAVQPSLSNSQCAWLRDALAIAHPGHAWIGQLTP